MTSDWSNLEIHQLVHGYIRGHELLGQSVRLSAKDLDETTRLSDLSGLQGQEETPPYLTCYPLPSGAYIAFARTWLDDTAPRGGCVLTHTLLIPTEAWSGGVSARALSCLFAQPRRAQLYELSSLRLTTTNHPVNLPLADDDFRSEIEDFCARYFIQGTSPIIWPITQSRHQAAEGVFLRLLDVLWPARRQAFSGTTFALQPRRGAQGPFQVMFVPVSVLGRFSNLPTENSVGRRNRSLSMEPRSQRVIRGMSDFLAGDPTSEWLDFEALRGVLPASADALVKVATLEDLAVRGRDNPMAFVAALDVWAGLAPTSDVASDRKKIALQAAIDRSVDLSPSEAIELLSAVLLRLRRPAFARLRSVSSTILSRMSALVHWDLDAALAIVQTQKRPPKELLAAIAKALMSSDTWSLTALEDFADAAPIAFRRLLAFMPNIVSAYLQRAAAHPTADTDAALQHVSEWLSATSPSTRRSALRALASAPAILDDETLLTAVLDSATPAQLPQLFALPSALHHTPASYVVGRLAALAAQAPEDALGFYRTNGVRSQIDAELLCVALGPDLDLLQVLHTVPFGSTRLRSAVISRHIVRGGGSLPPKAAAALLLDLLKSADTDGAPLLSQALELLMTTADSFYFEANFQPQALANLRPAELQKKMWLWLFSASLQRALDSDRDLSPYLQTSVVIKQLRAGAPDQVLSLITNADWKSAESVQAWALLRQLTPVLAQRSDRLLVDLLRHVFNSTQNRLESFSVKIWVEILQLLAGGPLAEPAQSMSFGLALSHRHLPVSPIVIATFAPLYEQLPQSRAANFWDVLLLSYAGDRRKDFRRNLVDAFLASSWPPGDLALAAHAAGALSKFVARLLTLKAGDYLEAMRSDLKSRGPRFIESSLELERLLRSRSHDLSDQ